MGEVNKITEGPWYIEKNEDSDRWMVVTADNKEILSAPRSDCDWGDICLARSAPYLLESLEEILLALDPEGKHPLFGKARIALQYAKFDNDEE